MPNIGDALKFPVILYEVNGHLKLWGLGEIFDKIYKHLTLPLLKNPFLGQRVNCWRSSLGQYFILISSLNYEKYWGYNSSYRHLIAIEPLLASSSPLFICMNPPNLFMEYFSFLPFDTRHFISCLFVGEMHEQSRWIVREKTQKWVPKKQIGIWWIRVTLDWLWVATFIGEVAWDRRKGNSNQYGQVQRSQVL